MKHLKFKAILGVLIIFMAGVLDIGCMPRVDTHSDTPIPSYERGIKVKNFYGSLRPGDWNYDLNKFLNSTEIEIISVREITDSNGNKHFQVWYKEVKN